MIGSITTFLSDESGATAVEYALMAGLIAGVIVFTVTSLGIEVKSLFETVEQLYPDATP